MVDEDPRRTHHPLRDAMKVVRTIDDFELRESEGRYLAILKPALEGAFLRAVRLLSIQTSLPSDPRTLRRVLAQPESHAHVVFLQTLARLYSTAEARGQSIFLTELVSTLQKVAGK